MSVCVTQSVRVWVPGTKEDVQRLAVEHPLRRAQNRVHRLKAAIMELSGKDALAPALCIARWPGIAMAATGTSEGWPCLGTALFLKN